MVKSDLLILAVAVVMLVVVVGKTALPDDVIDPDIKTDEGFVGNPYDDSRGIPTIGFGTRLPITRAEGELLLKHRLSGIEHCLADGYPAWRSVSQEARGALLNEMGYNLGCEGLLGFHGGAQRACCGRYGRVSLPGFEIASGTARTSGASTTSSPASRTDARQRVFGRGAPA